MTRLERSLTASNTTWRKSRKSFTTWPSEDWNQLRKKPVKRGKWKPVGVDERRVCRIWCGFVSLFQAQFVGKTQKKKQKQNGRGKWGSTGEDCHLLPAAFPSPRSFYFRVCFLRVWNREKWTCFWIEHGIVLPQLNPYFSVMIRPTNRCSMLLKVVVPFSDDCFIFLYHHVTCWVLFNCDVNIFFNFVMSLWFNPCYRRQLLTFKNPLGRVPSTKC